MRGGWKSQGIYPILDGDMALRLGQDPLELLESWKELPVQWFQLRWKSVTDETYLELATRLKEKCDFAGIIVNDRLDLFLKNQDLFFGIHLGQEDLSSASQGDLLQLLELSKKGEILTGVSTHSVEEVDRALSPLRDGGEMGEPIHWSYLAMGPFFETDSKREGLSPVLRGAKRQELLQRFHHILLDEKPGNEHLLDLAPVLIGGISEENLVPLLEEFRLAGTREVRPLIAVIQAAHHPDRMKELFRVYRSFMAV